MEVLKVCKKCKEVFVHKKHETWYDEKGSGYTLLLTKCPHCETINILKVIEDKGLYVNYDDRYYF